MAGACADFGEGASPQPMREGGDRNQSDQEQRVQEMRIPLNSVSIVHPPLNVASPV
jgi:hypothetical protein